MRNNNEEEVIIIEEQFSSLSDCTTYYYDELSKLSQVAEADFISNKEAKRMKKYIMKQFNANLKLLKAKDSHNRKLEKSSLKTSKSTSSATSTNTHSQALEPKATQYQIEDKKEKSNEKES